MPFYPFIDVESTHCSSDGGRSRSSNGCHPFHTFLAVHTGRQCCSRYSTEVKKATYLQNAQKSQHQARSTVWVRLNGRTGLDKAVCCIISLPWPSTIRRFHTDFTTHIYMTLLSAHNQRCYIVCEWVFPFFFSLAPFSQNSRPFSGSSRMGAFLKTLKRLITTSYTRTPVMCESLRHESPATTHSSPPSAAHQLCIH